MRLEYRHDPPAGHGLAGRFEHRAQLGRMMGVVVDDGHTATFAAHLESASHTAEIAARLGEHVEARFELESDSNYSGGGWNIDDISVCAY